jgi:hypothetical protein
VERENIFAQLMMYISRYYKNIKTIYIHHPDPSWGTAAPSRYDVSGRLVILALGKMKNIKSYSMKVCPIITDGSLQAMDSNVYSLKIWIYGLGMTTNYDNNYNF